MEKTTPLALHEAVEYLLLNLELDELNGKALSLPPSKTELPAASCHFLIRSKYEHYIKMVPPY
jgi:hypothetical protein